MFRCRCKNDLPARVIALSTAPPILRPAFFKLRAPPSVLIAVNYRVDATNV